MNMIASQKIRPATLRDTEALRSLAERTFRETFAEHNTADDMEAYIRESLSLERIRAELSDPANAFLLTFQEGSTVPCGYAKLRTGTNEPCVSGPDPVELERLYVSQKVLGQGVGAQLMQACLEKARADGFATLWLGVWEHNSRAQAFYHRWGFRRVGEHVFQLGSDPQTDLILERPVTERFTK